MDIYTLIFKVIALIIWTASSAFLTWPFKMLLNHSVLTYANYTCVQIFCTLLLVGYIVILCRRPATTPETKRP